MATHKITIRVPTKLYKVLKEEAGKFKNVSVREYTEALVSMHLHEIIYLNSVEGYKTAYENYIPWLAELENEQKN